MRAATRRPQPSHAQPGGWWQVFAREMQELPQALPLRQVLQQAASTGSSAESAVADDENVVAVARTNDALLVAALGTGGAAEPTSKRRLPTERTVAKNLRMSGMVSQAQLVVLRKISRSSRCLPSDWRISSPAYGPNVMAA